MTHIGSLVLFDSCFTNVLIAQFIHKNKLIYLYKIIST